MIYDCIFIFVNQNTSTIQLVVSNYKIQKYKLKV